MKQTNNKRLGKLRAIETDAVRVAMIEEGLNVSTLAKACGLQASSLGSALSKGFPDRLTRLKVEKAFDYRREFWSDRQTLQKRRRCQEKFGFDPYIIGVRALRRLGKDIGADFSRCLSKLDCIAEVFAREVVINGKPRTKN